VMSAMLPGLDLEPVDEIDHVVEPAAGADRMQLLAMAIARWVLPVPVPPTGTALRCWAMNPPLASSLTRVSLKLRDPTLDHTTRSELQRE
jgi:hypothetical protein